MICSLSMIFACLPVIIHYSSQPDPVALLRGVKQTREAIKNGYFEATAKTWSFQLKGSNEIKVRIWVKGKNITFFRKNRALRLKSGGGNIEEILRISRDNPEELVRTGLATWFEADNRSIWNGSQLLQYTFHENSAAYVQPIRGETEKMYDPRHFGVHQFFFLKQNIDEPLRLVDLPGVAYKIVGLEAVDGHTAWHVLATLPNKPDKHFWIDDTDQFRLYKMTVGNTTTISRFNMNDKHSIPYEVNVTEKDDKGTLRATWKWSNISYSDKYNDTIDVGDITSLGLQIGCPVSDDRMKKRLGYWNGTGLSEELGEAIQAVKIEDARVAAAKDYWRYFWILLCILVLGFGVYWVRRSFYSTA